MTLSAFTFVRNARRYYLPLDASIRSVLPLVDEVIVAVGDSDDDTRDWVASLDDRVRIIDTVWDTATFDKNTEYARQTDLARQACRGDWLLYIQADEVIHEDDHDKIRAALERADADPRVEGLLFDYLHFWGDYDHVHDSHAWYDREIRLIRNLPEIHSWRDAQSFRYWTADFAMTPEAYQSDTGHRKLRVRHSGARMFHYGYVRPPTMMSAKGRAAHISYHGPEQGLAHAERLGDCFDYGPLRRIPRFDGTHPAVMRPWIERFDWAGQLRLDGPPAGHKHERWRYRALSWVERHLLGGRRLGGFRNYTLLPE